MSAENTTTPSIDPASEAYLDVPDISPSVLNKLVLEYLIHNCFPETAHSFVVDALSDSSALSNADPLNNPNWIDSNGNLIQQKRLHDNEGDCEMQDASSTSERDPNGQHNHSDSIDALISPHLVQDHPQLQRLAKTLQPRYAIYLAILQGHLQKAIQLTRDSFPEALNMNAKKCLDIFFELECQQFIELVLAGHSEQALAFLTAEFGKYHSEQLGKSYLDRLSNIIPLLAYPDPKKSPLAHELGLARRERVASQLNQYLLKLYGLESVSGLERCIQQATVTRDVLNKEGQLDKKSNKVVYPTWKFDEFVAKI